MNWKAFLQTLAAVAIAGAAKAATGSIAAVGPTETVNWQSIGDSAMVGAVVAVLAVLTQAGAPPQPVAPQPAPAQG